MNETMRETVKLIDELRAKIRELESRMENLLKLSNLLAECLHTTYDPHISAAALTKYTQAKERGFQ
jgi:hypothetical protein